MNGTRLMTPAHDLHSAVQTKVIPTSVAEQADNEFEVEERLAKLGTKKSD